MSQEDLLILEGAANQLAAAASTYNRLRRYGDAAGFTDYENEEREALEACRAIRRIMKGRSSTVRAPVSKTENEGSSVESDEHFNRGIEAFKKWIKPWDERGQHPFAFQLFIGGWDCAAAEIERQFAKNAICPLSGDHP